MTDERIYSASIRAVQNIKAQDKGRRPARPTLHITWRAGKIESAAVLISAADVDCEESCQVRVRHDDSEALFHAAHATLPVLLYFDHPRYIADGLQFNRRLRVELPMARTPPVIVEFDVRGLVPPP